LNAFNDVLVKLGLSIPLGLILAFVQRSPQTITAGLLALITVVVASGFAVIEAGQLLLPSRVPDATDVYTGTVGTIVGLLIGRWLRAGS
jgi:glycopeptide antibiotics resistance protein